MLDVEHLSGNIVVVGGGLAGLMASVEAVKYVDHIVMVSKGRAGRSGNTIMSRNGMAAVVEEGFDGDSAQTHAADTMKGGLHLNNVRMVDRFSEYAASAIKCLQEIGVPFLTKNGELLRKGAPGHSHKRLLTVDGSSIKSPRTQGLALSLLLAKRAADTRVTKIEGVNIVRLIKYQGRVIGAVGLDRTKEKVWVFTASVLILACGGAGGLYPVTTNTADVTGDGYAMGRLAGAQLRDMEFVQFYPAVALGQPRMVLPSSCFADGAVLKNRLDERFMGNYSPQGEMATRDIMARANYEEIKSGRGTPKNGVYMDFSEMPPRILEERYPDVFYYLNGKEVVEVSPAMHFMMGGIAVDEIGGTTVPGLYAVGEVAGGLHGANRLAGNSLTEAAVFGKIAGREAAAESKTTDSMPNSSRFMTAENETLKEFLLKCNSGSKSLCQGKGASLMLPNTKKELRKILGDNVGLVRNETGLYVAVREIEGLKERLLAVKTVSYRELLEYQEALLMLETGITIAEAALKRKESIGSHYRQEENL